MPLTIVTVLLHLTITYSVYIYIYIRFAADNCKFVTYIIDNQV